jgi:ABC-type phosphate transport system auxiliary subunit
MIVIHRKQEIEVKEIGKESKFYNFNESFLDTLIMRNKLKFDKTQSTSTLKVYIPKEDELKIIETIETVKTPINKVENESMEAFEILKADKIRLKKEVYQLVKELTNEEAKDLVLFMESIKKKQVTLDIFNAFKAE